MSELSKQDWFRGGSLPRDAQKYTYVTEQRVESRRPTPIDNELLPVKVLVSGAIN